MTIIPGDRAVRCSNCGGGDTRVTDSRVTLAKLGIGPVIRRRRACKSCGYKNTTYEVDEVAFLNVWRTINLRKELGRHATGLADLAKKLEQDIG